MFKVFKPKKKNINQMKKKEKHEINVKKEKFLEYCEKSTSSICQSIRTFVKETVEDQFSIEVGEPYNSLLGSSAKMKNKSRLVCIANETQPCYIASKPLIKNICFLGSKCRN